MNKDEKLIALAAIKKCGAMWDNGCFCGKKSMFDIYPEVSATELEQAEEILRFCEDNGIVFIPVTDEAFPKELRENAEVPIGLFVKSEKPIKDFFGNGKTLVAIVGTRDISPYGKNVTAKLVGALKEENKNTVIVSGLALGVDAEAHRQALTIGLPTIAVMPCGLDTIYPIMHRRLAESIVENGGALVSQFVPHTSPMAINFIHRNHLIASMSETIFVTESKARGGAMVTARLGYEYGKRIYAVPGRIDDIRSRGCNDLIKQDIAEMYLPANE